MPDPDAARRAVHEGMAGYLDDGEIAVSWTLTIEVTGTDGVRYLAHRAGGGHDGTDAPMAWTALGMLTASADLAREQLRESTEDVDDDPDDE